MLELCRQARRLETGGVLVGRYSSDQRIAQVDVATGPGSDSQAGGTWLVRGVRGLQKVLDAFWSQKRGYYVGEWHFHPGAAPCPSHRDVSQMRSIAKSNTYHCPEPLLIILGGDPDGAYSLHAEVFTRSGRRIVLHGCSVGAGSSSAALLPTTPGSLPTQQPRRR
ncbi:MAG: Mov34/MPN/PAD-1 family protein [Phycisphaeraceae bacterium]|nr:Mov34/MPN/PAD-1 family protein [Phycisphaeraceae bacterium]